MAEAEGGPNIQSGRIAGLDTSVAHPARVYDYWLGGKDNFAADREAAERVLAAAPGLRFRVRANRAFLGRTTRYLAAEAGIRQFLDIGTGIPTGDNTHEVAQREAPDARVVYVDNDRCKSGCAHARAWPVRLPEAKFSWSLPHWLLQAWHTRPAVTLAVELGRQGGLKGGRARAEKLTPEQRSEIARKAARARWSSR